MVAVALHSLCGEADSERWEGLEEPEDSASDQPDRGYAGNGDENGQEAVLKEYGPPFQTILRYRFGTHWNQGVPTTPPRAPAIPLNAVVTPPPTAPTAPSATTAIKATSRPYSGMAAPRCASFMALSMEM